MTTTETSEEIYTKLSGERVCLLEDREEWRGSVSHKKVCPAGDDMVMTICNLTNIISIVPAYSFSP
jgi:hypothetical protein